MFRWEAGLLPQKEASSHQLFKDEIIKTKDGGTSLTLKDLTPVRLIKNKFFKDVTEAIQRGATAEEQQHLLGQGRAKKGMFEGDLDGGELEIGQVAGLIDEIKPVRQIMDDIMVEYRHAIKECNSERYNF